ncbi:Oidioi.mRNA.OKI2018_I69.PAR.g10687.t1.cds [Oikopleura dioica]|uniref:Oidioi.mRNA.OKI2018_I69.PAR.g10687.t1.cds n=1 Tax=Oikopleura dioica TaxID=34765 RepID=A0ABN7RW82_OIKDI|nr:Oidioi.mRNA.OKI2018_I69.PAR.g10687.t1.cds [Oikopleura dioica]
MKISIALFAFSAAQEFETEAQRVDTQPSLFDILIAQKTGLQLFQIYGKISESIFAEQVEKNTMKRRGPRLLNKFVELKNFATKAFAECQEDPVCLESCYDQLMEPNGDPLPKTSGEILSRFASVSDCLTTQRLRNKITRKSNRLAEKFLSEVSN